VAVASVAEARVRVLRPGASSRRWADAGVAVALLAVGVGGPLAAAAWLHALGIPRNDDWSYRLVLSRFAETGHYRLQGWGAMTLVGQVLWAAPFVALLGPHPWVPGASVAVAGAGGIVAAYWLARSLLPRYWAAACVLAVMAFPGFLLNTSSFMTDVPAFSAAMGCLALGAAAASRTGASRWALLSGSLAVGLFGFSVREFDLAAPAAVLATMAGRDRAHRRLYVASGAALLAACAAIFAWTAQLPGAQPVLGQATGPAAVLSAAGTRVPAGLPSPPFWRVAGASLQSFAEGYFTLAFALAPLLALSLPGLRRRTWPRGAPRPRRVLARAGFPAVVLALGVALLVANGSVFVGNYLAQQGATANQELPGVRPELFPGPLWLVLGAVAVAAGGLLAVALAAAGSPAPARLARLSRAVPSPAPPAPGAYAMLVGFSALTAVGLGAYGVFLKGELFDRYLWPLIFGLAVLLARRHLAQAAGWPSRLYLRLLAGAVGALAVVVAVAVTLNSDSFDAARWAAGQELVAMGVPSTKVDAGFEWVGYHYPGLAVHGRDVPGGPPYDKWYEATFPGFSACAVVASSPLGYPGLALARTEPYREVGFAGAERLYLYQVKAPGCAPVGVPGR